MKNKKQSQNYLDYKPSHAEGLDWSQNENGEVILHKPNKGITNKIFQIFFKKPKVSYIHLDEMGNFIWPLIDGEKTVEKLGEYVKEHFGDAAEPLYPRLCQYIKTLEKYGFITNSL